MACGVDGGGGGGGSMCRFVIGKITLTLALTLTLVTVTLTLTITFSCCIDVAHVYVGVVVGDNSDCEVIIDNGMV